MPYVNISMVQSQLLFYNIIVMKTRDTRVYAIKKERLAEEYINETNNLHPGEPSNPADMWYS